jgi:hypothetical protein
VRESQWNIPITVQDLVVVRILRDATDQLAFAKPSRKGHTWAWLPEGPRGNYLKTVE